MSDLLELARSKRGSETSERSEVSLSPAVLPSHPSLLSRPRAVRRRRPKWVPRVPCATCGLRPTDTFDDGSPRYDHGHDFATGETWWAATRTAVATLRRCPACRHEHAAVSTCLECPGCRSGDLVRAAEEVFGELLPRDAGERGAVGHPGQGAPSETRCEGDGGSLGREAGAVGSGPARRVLDGPRSTAIAGHTDSKGAAR